MGPSHGPGPRGQYALPQYRSRSDLQRGVQSLSPSPSRFCVNKCLRLGSTRASWSPLQPATARYSPLNALGPRVLQDPPGGHGQAKPLLQINCGQSSVRDSRSTAPPRPRNTRSRRQQLLAASQEGRLCEIQKGGRLRQSPRNCFAREGGDEENFRFHSQYSQTNWYLSLYPRIRLRIQASSCQSATHAHALPIPWRRLAFPVRTMRGDPLD